MTNPQTEARAIALAGIGQRHLDNWTDDDFRKHTPAVRAALSDAITRLASKDAELENSVKMIVHLQAEIVRVKKRAETQLVELKDRLTVSATTAQRWKDRWNTKSLAFDAARDRADRAEAQLAAKDAELEEVKEMYAREGAKALYELERAELAEAQLAEANKALETILAMVGNVEHKGGGSNAARMYADVLNDIRQIARRACEAQEKGR